MYKILIFLVPLIAASSATECLPSYSFGDLTSKNATKCSAAVEYCACIDGTINGTKFYVFDCEDIAKSVLEHYITGFNTFNYKGHVSFSCEDKMEASFNDNILQYNYQCGKSSSECSNKDNSATASSTGIIVLILSFLVSFS